MAAPSGYTNLVLHDTFAGTTLDLTKWSPALGANGDLWNNYGKLGNDPNGFPYTGYNTPDTTDSELYVPTPNKQITVNNGLTITATPNTARLNPGGVHYQYLSGALTSVAQPGHGPGESANFVLPQTGKQMVRINCKMPDMNRGIAPCMWFMPGNTGGNSNELDFLQGCFTGSPGPQNNKPLGTGYFANGDKGQASPDVGFDSTAAFHVYGIEVSWVTQTITGYADHKVMWTYKGTLSPQQYEIILNVQCWLPGQGWCTGVDGVTGGSWEIAEVQAWVA